MAVALFGTCQLTRSEPVILCSLILPLENSTRRSTAMESPAKTNLGRIPPTAICIGAKAGEGVLQTKSLLPFEVARERIAASNGWSEVSLTANAPLLTSGLSLNSTTFPLANLRSLKPVGINRPLLERSSRVKFASATPGTNNRK